MNNFKRAILCIFLVMVASAALASDDNDFVNATSGLGLRKPPDWVYVTAAQHSDNLRKIKLSDQEFQAAMQKYSTAPLVAMTKHEEPFDDLNPSFKVNLKPYGELKGKTPIELLGFLVPQFERLFKDFAVVQAPIEVSVAGVASGYARMNYTMEIPDGRTFPTTSELWIVPHGDYFFLIGAGTRQDEKTGTREEIQQILRTVVITR